MIHPETPMTILVIDDDDLVRGSIEMFLQRRGHRTIAAEDGRKGLGLVAVSKPDLVLLDLRMPGMDGLEVLKALREQDEDLPVIVVSGAGVIGDVVASLRLGAWDFLIKPFEDLEILDHAVRKATEQGRLRRENRDYHSRLETLVRKRTSELEAANWELTNLRARLEQENEYLREEIFPAGPARMFVGQSRDLLRIQREIEQVAPTEAAVMVTGETGTGKELVARAIHKMSLRRDRPLIKVNCASIPKDLFESEFFGHIQGSFTGAVKDRVGRFQLANNGTLFLDEVAEIPSELQVKLLRVLQEGEIERVGEGLTRHVDVRVIAATNRDLEQEIRTGRFREDLYYRLNVYPIHVPPLRERRDDIAPLAHHFLAQAARKFGRDVAPLRIKHIMELEAYHWPGNVRELQNVLERAVITSTGTQLRIDLKAVGKAPAAVESVPEPGGAAGGVLTEAQMRNREKINILRALRQSDWRVFGPQGAASLLGIKPTTLTSRMKAMNISRPRGETEG